MVHCCRENSEENAKCRSSQVFGESTAQTVIISSIAFMPNFLWCRSAGDNVNKLRNRPTRSFTRRGNPRPGRLEIQPKHQPCLLALEIHEIKRSARARRAAPRLEAPARCQTSALRQLEISGRADKESLA